MSHALTVRQLRRILENAVSRRYGMTLDDYIRLNEQGSAPSDPNLQYLLQKLLAATNSD